MPELALKPLRTPGAAQPGTTGSRLRADLEERGDVLELEARFERERARSEAVEVGGHPDARDRAGERGARAHVRAVTEAEVLVRVGPVGLEVLGVGEDLFVAVRAAHPDDHAFADAHRRARDRGRVHAAAGDEQDRRADAQALLDRAIEHASLRPASPRRVLRP